MHEIYELKEMLCAELEKYGSKGDLSAGELEIVDKLAHSVKNLGKIIEMDEGMSSREGGSTRRRAYREGSYRDGGSYREGSYRDGSRRESTRRRNKMEQYTREGEDEFREMLEECMEYAPNEQIRSKVERIMEQM